MQHIYLKHNYQPVYPGRKVKSQSPMRFELQEIRTITALIKTKKDWTRVLFEHFSLVLSNSPYPL